MSPGTCRRALYRSWRERAWAELDGAVTQLLAVHISFYILLFFSEISAFFSPSPSRQFQLVEKVILPFLFERGLHR